MTQPDRSVNAVSGRIATLFGVRVVAAVVGVVNAFVLARLLEPAGKGDFYLVQLLPSTLLVLGQLGLPSAINYYAGRGQTRGLARRAVLLALGLSGIGIAITVALLPILDASLFRAVDPGLVAIALTIVPFTFLFTFSNAVLTGRQAIGLYGAVALGQVVAALLLFLVLISVLDFGVTGAILAYLAYTSVAAVIVTIGAIRVTRGPSDQPAVRLRDLFGYGLRLYPASISGFFSYRADVYLLALILADPAQLGLYSVAVGLAELAFFLPDSVVTVFFPHVAGGTRADADKDSSVVTRVTIAATGLSVIPLVVAAFIAVHVVLPAYTDSLPALWVLLPGIVLLSASKTLSAYLNGIGRGTIVSGIAMTGLAINVGANVLLIPRFGIVGAAAASLVSYSLSAVIQVTICSRLTGTRPRAFLVPTREDARLIRAGIGPVLDRLRHRGFVAGSRP